MKNRKGFTLIEIIGAIIILGIISIVALLTYRSSLNDFRNSYYSSLERTLVESGKEFFDDNRNYRPSTILSAQTVPISLLESHNYIDLVKDYSGKRCDKSSYVIIIKKSKNDYLYHTCLSCSEDSFTNVSNKYCDSSWLNSSTIGYDLDPPSDIYVYKGTSQAELKGKLELPISIVKKNELGEEIERVKGNGIDDVETILPSNIDTIDTSKIGEYKTIYEYNGNKVEGRVFVYENDAPIVKITSTKTTLSNLNGDTTTSSEYEYAGNWEQYIKLSFKPGSGKYTESGAKVSRYQWSKGEEWNDICIADDFGLCYKEYDGEMNEEIRFRIVDSDGNISKETNPITIKIDNTKPKCKLSLEGTKGNNDWYVGNVTVKFSVKDDQLSGVNEAKSGISVNNINLSNATLSRLTSNDSVEENRDLKNVKYIGFVEDRAGNYVLCSIEFKKDSTPPTCTQDGGSTSWTNGTRTIKYGCSDVTSNCLVSEVGSKEYSSTKKTDNMPEYNIEDYAGNKVTCPVKSANVYVDTTKPSCVLEVKSGTMNSENTLYLSSVKVGFKSATDSDSEVEAYGIGSVTGNKEVTHTTNNTKEYVGYIRDNAGNENTCKLSVTKNSALTLTYDSNGGNACSPATKTINYDDTYGTLCSATRTGYTLDGWYTAKTEGTKITATTKVTVTSNQTLYAHWTANKYTLTYDNKGGSGCSSKQGTYGAKWGDLCTPTRSGYDFDGWFTAASGGTKITKNTLVDGDKKVYAHWSSSCTKKWICNKEIDDDTNELWLTSCSGDYNYTLPNFKSNVSPNNFDVGTVKTYYTGKNYYKCKNQSGSCVKSYKYSCEYGNCSSTKYCAQGTCKVVCQ